MKRVLQRVWQKEELLQIDAFLNEGKAWEDIAKVFSATKDAVVSAHRRWRKRRDHVLRTGSVGCTVDESVGMSELERKLQYRTDEVNLLRAKVRNAQRFHGLVDECVKVVTDIYEPLKTVDPPKMKQRKSQEEVDAVLFMTDQHADRIVQSEGVWGLDQYDFNVFRARLWEWVKVTTAYTTIHLPNYFFKTLWVLHLGDAVNGDIHNMKLRNQWGNSIKAAIATGDVQAEALQALLPAFEKIIVVCISGNHGRTTKQIELEDPHDNLDYLVAATMRQRLRDEPRIEIVAPKSWSAFADIRGHLCELSHGTGAKGVWGIPWYYFDRREGQVRSIVAAKERFINYHFYGHLHTPMTRPAGQGTAIHGGSWYMTDEFALNIVRGANVPVQQLLVWSERFGRQFEIPIFLRDEEKENAMRAGEWDPPLGRSNIVDELTPDHAPFEMPIIGG